MSEHTKMHLKKALKKKLQIFRKEAKKKRNCNNKILLHSHACITHIHTQWHTLTHTQHTHSHTHCSSLLLFVLSLPAAEQQQKKRR